MSKLYNLEWETYIGRLNTALIKSQTYIPQVVVELAPGFSVKTALTLRELNFTGTLYVIDSDKKVCEFVENEYWQYLSKAKIVVLNKRFEYAIANLPERIDLFIVNHALSDLIITEYLDLKGKVYSAMDTNVTKCWKMFEDDPSNVKAVNKVFYAFYTFFRQRQATFVLMSQYKDANTECEESYKWGRELINKLRFFLSEVDSTYLLKNSRPFEDNKKFLTPFILNNVQNGKNWLLGTPKEKDDVKSIYNVLKEPLFNILYRRTRNFELLRLCGYIECNFKVDYNTTVLTTPIDKITIDEQTVKPVVLLTTGFCNPISPRHIQMMDKAKLMLNNSGYTVVGGYISPLHENFTARHDGLISDQFERIAYNYDFLKDNKWINLDLWESLCNKDYINFTTVIDRLEKYLQKFVRPDIKVAYVCDDSNMALMNVFREKGIGVCVYRNNPAFEDNKKKIFGPNIFYVKDNTALAPDNVMGEIPLKNEISGIYLVQDEGAKVFDGFKASSEVKAKAQEYFKTNFAKILKKYVDRKISYVKVDDEVDIIKDDIEGQKTVSLSPYFDGDYNLSITKKYPICAYQDVSDGIAQVPFRTDMIEYLESIDDKEPLTLVTESIDAKMLGFVQKYFNISKVVKASDYTEKKIFCHLRLRDFIFGGNNSGLLVEFNGLKFLAPYIFPYVNLFSRADILNFKEFSNEIIQLNIQMYQTYFSNLRVKDLDASFLYLCGLQEFDVEEKAYVVMKNLLL